MIAIAVIALVVVTSNSDSDGDTQAQQRTVVTYEVSGAAGAVELSYRDTEHQVPPTTVPLPWSKEVTLYGADAYFDVSARTADGTDQELTCRVTANGLTVVEDRTVSGLIGCMGRLNEF
ncbi:MmpS family transport accessory protein [Mycobacterium syngnathidarum]